VIHHQGLLLETRTVSDMLATNSTFTLMIQYHPLMIGTDMASETLNTHSILTLLTAEGNFTAFIRRESFK
jgi:hypothetical protein